jgi:predicted nucleic acid-binding protein
MPSIIILDTGPLSNSVIFFAKPGDVPTLSQQCRRWISDCEHNGVTLLVPAICYYEALRELKRRSAADKIARLQEFVFGAPNRYIPLTTAHLEMAAQMWGEARNAGIQTASNDALDADVILCAQALSLGLSSSDYIVATTNIGHLSRFVPCDEWTNINP